MHELNNLEKAVEQINVWRKQRKTQRGRIPEEFWKNAIELSKTYSPHIVAKELNLKLSDLQSKIDDISKPLSHMKKEKTKQKRKKSSSTITFVEAVPAPITKKAERCILELELNNGAKVRVYQ